MRHPYELYDAYIGIDDIQLSKIKADCTPTHLQAILEKAISKGIAEGLRKYGIEEYIPTTSLHVSVDTHYDDWRFCGQELPDYDVSVLVCLKDGSTRVMTHRSKKDYSKDCYDFLHVSICEDAMYWMPLPDTPDKIKSNYILKDIDKI